MTKRFSTKRLSHRLTYDTKELANAIGACTATIDNYRKQGMPTIDGKKPFVFKGGPAKDFIDQKNENRKVKLKVGEFFCFRCKVPRRSKPGQTEYCPGPQGARRMSGKCEVCEGKLNRTLGPDITKS